MTAQRRYLKVGDTVKCTDRGTMYIGKTAEVLEVMPLNCVHVRFYHNGRGFICNTASFELITE